VDRLVGIAVIDDGWIDLNGEAHDVPSILDSQSLPLTEC
jgi:hypothetical protein